jgi:hypothetical protein
MEFILHWKIYQEAADREKYPLAQEHGSCLLLAQNHWTMDIHMNYGHNVYWQNISGVVVWIMGFQNYQSYLVAQSQKYLARAT